MIRSILLQYLLCCVGSIQKNVLDGTGSLRPFCVGMVIIFLLPLCGWVWDAKIFFFLVITLCWFSNNPFYIIGFTYDFISFGFCRQWSSRCLNVFFHYIAYCCQMESLKFNFPLIHVPFVVCHLDFFNIHKSMISFTVVTMVSVLYKFDMSFAACHNCL